jgi:enamine deaminase RidA (YjgF/YER057c/UK114 family)
MDLHNRLHALGHSLPTTSKPGGHYVSVNVRGNTAFVAIQFPIRDGVFQYQGVLGDTLGTADGRAAMELCALNVLAQMEARLGFERVEGLDHLEAVYRAAPGWDDAPAVVDGASELFAKVLDDKGRHSRSIFGVAHLPRGFCVGLTCRFTLRAD